MRTTGPDYETAWALLADEQGDTPLPNPAPTRTVEWRDVRVALVELAALAAGFEPTTGMSRGIFGGTAQPAELDRVNEVLGRFGIPPFALVDPEVARERLLAETEARFAELFAVRETGPTWAERYGDPT